MTHLLSKINSIALIACIAITSCKKGASVEKAECYNMTELNAQKDKTLPWVVNDTIGSKTIIDDLGVKQTLIISGRDPLSDYITEDYCGNSFPGFSSTVYYDTSLSPLNISAYILASANPDEGFILRLSVTHFAAEEASKEMYYDFRYSEVRDGAGSVKVLPELKVSKKTYKDVLELTFSTINSKNDIETIYFAKGYGIVKFTKANGLTFNVE